MKNICIVSLMLLIALTACKKPQHSIEVNEKWKFEELSLEKKIFLDNDSTKGGVKLTLEFNFPTQIENDSLLNAIQSHFVTSFVGNEYKHLTPQDAFDTLVNKSINQSIRFTKLALRDKSDLSDYYKNVITSVFDTTNISITARTETNEYMGGAHGSQYIAYNNIDIRTGSQIVENILFRTGSKEKLTTYIKEELAKTLNNQGDTITLFDIESVIPSENFYFNKTGIVYVYNSYEVAPYSDGLVEATIPYAKIKDLIAPEYLSLIALKSKE